MNTKFSSKKRKIKAFDYFNSQGAIITTANQGAKAASVGDSRGYQNTCSDQERSIDCNSDKVMMKLPSDNEEFKNENPTKNYWGSLPGHNKKSNQFKECSDQFSHKMTKGQSTLNVLKDKVIRIVLLQGDKKVETEPLSDMLDEVDEAMKKSKLFTMTQLTPKKNQ